MALMAVSLKGNACTQGLLSQFRKAKKAIFTNHLSRGRKQFKIIRPNGAQLPDMSLSPSPSLAEEDDFVFLLVADVLTGVPSAAERSRAKLLPLRVYETSGLSMLISSSGGGAFADVSASPDF